MCVSPEVDNLMGISCFLTSDLCYVFFFFQAEDGIRYGTVTGVQTCALPILGARGDFPIPSIAPVVAKREPMHEVREIAARRSKVRRRHRVRTAVDIDGAAIHRISRSEERRVGKECRCRWSWCH